MFETISFLVALIGSSISSVYDLKTTEIPDIIPHSMMVIGITINLIQSIILWNYYPILASLIAGLGLLGFGFLMYFLGQWGGGDAKILAAMGFLLPTFKSVKLNLPFPLTYTLNVFVIGAAYMLLYAFLLSLKNKKIWREFFKDLKASSSVLLLASTTLFLSFLVLNSLILYYLNLTLDFLFIFKNSLLPLFLTMIVFIIWKFGKAVEETGMKKRIPISKLKVGDVLLESKIWEGITEKDLKKIKRSGKKWIWIKEGIRFAPSFPLALIFTYFYGNSILLLIGLI